MMRSVLEGENVAVSNADAVFLRTQLAMVKNRTNVQSSPDQDFLSEAEEYAS
jgi:hypothetical protein